jgi:DNA-binding NarL/FixJ family response regulator
LSSGRHLLLDNAPADTNGDRATVRSAKGHINAPDIHLHRCRNGGAAMRLMSTLNRLTAREQTVLALMAEGRSNDAIAQRMGVGGKTVETYVRNIFLKLGLEQDLADHRRVLAVLAYLEH